MKLIVVIISALYGLVSSYKMGNYITCLEQNDEDPEGFREKDTWLNPDSIECQKEPELCRIYKEEEPYPSAGDVCDHEDPDTGKIRDACMMAVIFGEKVNENKTWAWKCASLALCPLPGEEGCKITRKRITCCCQSDYCNGQQLYRSYAAYGRAMPFPPNYDEILAIPIGEVKVVVDVPGYPSTIEQGYGVSIPQPQYTAPIPQYTPPQYTSPQYTPPQTPQLPLNPFSNNYDDDARNYMYAHKGYDNVDGNVEANDGIAIAQVLLIFAYFLIGTVCLGIGVCIGVRWKSNVLKKREQWNDI